MNAAALADVARYRAVENLRPGHWWLGEYEDADGKFEPLWAKASIILSLTQIGTGHRVVRVIGRATTGEPVELIQYRGFAVESVTERQGEKIGLAVS